MLGLIVAFLVLLVLTAVYVVRPLLAAESAEDVAVDRGAQLSSEEKVAIDREIRWRLEHDRASGRLDDDEYRRALATLEASAPAGTAGGE